MRLVPNPDRPPSLKEVREIAEDSANVVILFKPKQKGRVRKISSNQVVLCCQKGTFHEGPFRNERHDWQVTMYRHAAGEEIKVVVIVKDAKLYVRSNH